MNKKELADLLVISTRRLNQLMRDGTIPKTSDLFRIVTSYIRFIRKNPELVEAQLRRAVAKAKLDELRALQEEGKLIDKDQPLRWLEGHVTTAKEAFWTLPRRTAEIFAAETDPRTIEFIHQEEIRRILTDLADGKVEIIF